MNSNQSWVVFMDINTTRKHHIFGIVDGQQVFAGVLGAFVVTEDRNDILRIYNFKTF